MKPSVPIGTPHWGPFFIRVSLGSYLFLVGLAQLADIPAFVEVVRSLNLVPVKMVPLVGTLIPYLEIASGTLLVLGFWTTLASLTSSVLIGAFIWALGLYPHSSEFFNKDIILLGASISLLFSGSGALSLDGFRKV